MAEFIHPFYESHRSAMEAAMRHRFDLAEAMLCERAHLSDIDGIKQEVMDEFEIVLTQMPYVGGAASRMSDFFMRLTLNSASTTKLAAFANSRLATEIGKSCRTFAGLISTPMQRQASTWKGHKPWLAARATAISDSRGFRRTRTTDGRPRRRAFATSRRTPA
jgi:hypothetical protein